MKKYIESAAIALAVVLAVSTPTLAFDIVYDPTQAFNMGQQLQQSLQQIEQLKQQLDTAQKQLSQLSDLHKSLNQITSIGDLASSLKDPSITQYLPPEFKQYSGPLNGLLKDNANGFAQKYDHYTSTAPGENFYQEELQRQKQETYTDMSVGQAVYDTASKRIQDLETLRDKVKTASTPKEAMDLQARIAAEQALLQNEILRMKGLAMVQEARNRVDSQREREEYHKFADQVHALTGGH
ncbi:P-type DNA transfer protein VirB5 [Bradyrhizobium brasilense]|uniref:Type IV secretion system protein VirB5 n=1 Tax=Bradyrhizobium brasilense TaxID=1419277 RepID=A0A1G7NLC5_9BRAD|nr:P-type DNA transfer protein VirB5 [Bradyrhizobium brasilense]MCC8976693.1 P-type DNA transfer protein VirB5 [Bradyrhizobium brasilense]SDF74813.1 type IV secretion system protein VirB5 [Bradyrhizobium brasilense]